MKAIRCENSGAVVNIDTAAMSDRKFKIEMLNAIKRLEVENIILKRRVTKLEKIINK